MIVSDELDDLRVCDRVLALFHGRVVAEFGSGWTDHELVAAMEGVGGEGAGHWHRDRQRPARPAPDHRQTRNGRTAP